MVRCEQVGAAIWLNVMPAVGQSKVANAGRVRVRVVSMIRDDAMMMVRIVSWDSQKEEGKEMEFRDRECGAQDS